MLSCLVLDIGNTNAHFAIWRAGSLFWQGHLATRAPDNEIIAFVQSELHNALQNADIFPLRCMYSSVSQQFGEHFSKIAEQTLQCRIERLTYRESPLQLCYAHPERLGTDRIANATAAFHHCSNGAIVIDMGTATHFDIVSPAGEFLGGPIAPGISACREAFLRSAPHLADQLSFDAPSVVAQNTLDALSAGQLFYAVGGIQYIIQEIKKSVHFHPSCILTGGNGAVFEPYLRDIDMFLPTLTLEGLALICCRNAETVSTG